MQLSSLMVRVHIWTLSLKAPSKKMHLKMSSAEVVCCKYLPNIFDELTIEANSVDPKQTAHKGAVWSGPHCLPKRLLKHFSKWEKQTTFFGIGASRGIFVFLNQIISCQYLKNCLNETVLLSIQNLCLRWFFCLTLVDLWHFCTCKLI